MRTVTATRYVTALREGGSLPAIVEGDDSGLYVAKFCGAGQGAKALVAELVVGELARAAGLASRSSSSSRSARRWGGTSRIRRSGRSCARASA